MSIMLGVMILTMLVGFALSLPVAVTLALATMAGMVGFSKLPLLVLAQQLFVTLDQYPLVAVPLFILAGDLMEAGGISRRLVDFAKALVGEIRGGLAAACVISCMIFAAISGSGVATTFAVGAIMIPALVKQGYPAPFATSVQAASAELGVIIPPSIPMILYAVAAEVSVGQLFIAGFGPGLLIGGALIATVMVWVRVRGVRVHNDSDARIGFWLALRRAIISLLLPVVILGGIYGGVFTPTEAAAVAVVSALLIGLLVHRELRPGDLLPVMRKSLRSTASIMIIIATAGAFSYVINRAGVPAQIGAFLSSNFDSGVIFLLGVNLALFLIGMFLETAVSIIILAPILAPVAAHFGIDPIHFGVIMVVNLALGMITPPFGVNLFAACQVAGVPIHQIIPTLLVFVAVVAACLMVITYVPAVSLFLIR